MSKKLDEYPIDFVITWVDGNDSEWKKEYNKYKGLDGDQAQTRFRDMDTLQYWFRGVEKYAPWVNKIYFVTCGQRPQWLNANNSKLICMDHKDFIPKEYLPTFSSHAIEMNLHRISGLSEHFVYFNDDTFIIDKVNPDTFFKKGLPRQAAVINYPVPMEEPLNLVPVVNTAVINKHFVKKEVMKKQIRKFYTLKYHKYVLKNIQFIMGKWFPGFKYFHQPAPFLKATYNEVWEKEYAKLHNTCMHKFRVLTDVNQWLIQDWQICKGEFEPQDTKIGYYGSIENNERLFRTIEAMKSKMYKLVCANDNGIEDFKLMKEELINVFEEIFPDKSKFEI